MDIKDAKSQFPCSRCSGSGRLAHHANVLSGVCFKCGGRGTQKSRPATSAPKWDVYAVERATGSEIRVCSIRAKNEDKAIRMARVKLASAPGYFPETVRVVVA